MWLQNIMKGSSLGLGVFLMVSVCVAAEVISTNAPIRLYLKNDQCLVLVGNPVHSRSHLLDGPPDLSARLASKGASNELDFARLAKVWQRFNEERINAADPEPSIVEEAGDGEYAWLEGTNLVQVKFSIWYDQYASGRRSVKIYTTNSTVFALPDDVRLEIERLKRTGKLHVSK